MSRPIEVTIVKRKRRAGQVLTESALLFILCGLIGGYWLMLLLPLATDAFGFDRLAPGYLTCAAIVSLTRAAFANTFGTIKPEAS